MNVPGACFFCSRPNGTLTPLIPADELPYTVIIRGMPRVITPSETHGMTSCGVAVPRSEPWIIEGLEQTPHPVANKEGIDALQDILIRTMGDGSVPVQIRQDLKQLMYKGLDRAIFTNGTDPQAMAIVPTATPANAVGYYGNPGQAKQVSSLCSSRHLFTLTDYPSSLTTRRSTAPTGSATASVTTSNKVSFSGLAYKDYLLNYFFKGCLYRHEMPTQPEMLDKLGLRDIPRWYREKHNMPSILQPGNSVPRVQNYAAMVEQPAPKVVQYVPDNMVANHNLANTNSHSTGHPYHRGTLGRAAKSPRGNGGGIHHHGKSRSAHGNCYKHGQTAQAHHNAPNAQGVQNAPNGPSALGAAGAQDTPSPMEATFAQVAARNGKLVTPETSPSTDASNFTNRTGANKAGFVPKKNVDGIKSNTHEAIHNSIMNNEDALLRSLGHSMLNLNTHGGVAVTKAEELNAFSRKSRRLFDSHFGNDGADSCYTDWYDLADDLADAFGMPNSKTPGNDGGHALALAYHSQSSNTESEPATSILNALVSDSEPSENEQALAKWGPIDKHVQAANSAETTNFQAANSKSIAEMKLALVAADGNRDSGKPSAIDIARSCHRIANFQAWNGNDDEAKEWDSLSKAAHAKATFAWRLMVNTEFGPYAHVGPDLYTVWRQKRGIHDFPYVTGNRANDLALGFRVPYPTTRDCSKRDIWLRHHREMIRRSPNI